MEKHRVLALVALVIGFVAIDTAALAAEPPGWLQWGSDAQHTGFFPVAAQPPEAILSDTVVDPNAQASYEEVGGDLLVHYQVPLTQGNSVYMTFKGPDWTSFWTWQTQSWGMKRMDWKKGQLTTKWSRSSDWKPVPNGQWKWVGYWLFEGPQWEPVFHGAVAGTWVYMPGAGGSIYKLRKDTGAVVSRIKPFGATINPNVYANSPVTVWNGNVYYNVIQLDPDNPWTSDVVGSWLVRIAPNGTVTKVSYASLTPGAPGATDPCTVQFGNASDASSLPWPPSPTAIAGTTPCGTQRVGTNIAPAVAPDGTVYTASRAHFVDRYSYLIAVHADLTPKWAASLRGRLNDGCNVTLPPNGSPGGCTDGATTGVDPATNELPAGRIYDDSTASPTVAPDGSVLFGVLTRYNFDQGHLMRFSSAGDFLGAYGFGWDMTAGIFPHDLTYSIIFKENHYGDVGSYCNVESICPSDRTATYPSNPEAYFVTQLSPSLVPEWQWQNTNTESCVRNPDASITCTSDHPNGFEFCVNAVAIDANGVVYADSEDGNVYAVAQGGTLAHNLFLNLSLGAAYTPVSIGSDGKVYSQNFGHMLVTGLAP
ncbi:MAG TPA: hypothetical protein VFS34_06570 [Thermoanaerobaculia bacterium]|nr:hypothetical protein [Thermoanaerobaculia bacterium]